MAKHASNNFHDLFNDDDKSLSDEPIGLTEAFAPVKSDDRSKDSTDDDRIGLTEAFEPVKAQGGKHAGGFSYQGDVDEDYPDACENLEPLEAAPLLFGESGSEACPESPSGKHGKEYKQPLAPYQRKSRHMRRILIALVVLLTLLIAALGYFTWQWFEESRLVANRQVQQTTQEVDAMQQGQNETKDASTAVTKKTNVPPLVPLLTMTKHDAIVALKHGATEVSSKELDEDDNPVKTNVTVKLTDEPADARSGAPTVYLGLNEDGLVVQAGYSAAVASLGYGPFSFIDIVKDKHIIEKTLQEAGISVAEGSAKLPSDKNAYSEYASDKKTLVKETCSFSGKIDINDAPHEWSSVLVYDYTAANLSGNLADTIRIIYIYINA